MSAFSLNTQDYASYPANATTFGGKTYYVTPDNYGSVAMSYIDYRRAAGDTMYDDSTPALAGNVGTGLDGTIGFLASERGLPTQAGVPTTAGKNNQLATINAMRTLASLAPTTGILNFDGSVTPDTGAATNFLNNPVTGAINSSVAAVDNAGKALASVISGAGDTVSNLSNLVASLGKILSTAGGLIVVGGIAWYLMRRKR